MSTTQGTIGTGVATNGDDKVSEGPTKYETADRELRLAFSGAASQLDKVAVAVVTAFDLEVWQHVTHSQTGKPFGSFAAYIKDRSSDYPVLSKALSKQLMVILHDRGMSLRAIAGVTNVSSQVTVANVVKAARVAQAKAADAAVTARLTEESKSDDEKVAKAAASKLEARTKRAEEAAQRAAEQAKVTTATRTLQAFGNVTEQLSGVLADLSDDELAVAGKGIADLMRQVKATQALRTEGTSDKVVRSTPKRSASKRAAADAAADHAREEQLAAAV